MPSYKLLYIDARGRAEVARMLFHLQGQKFEDVRYPMGSEELMKAKTDKSQLPLGQGPVLVIDDFHMPQSTAIWRYLAREFGYYGNTNLEGAKIDLIIETIADIEQKLIVVFTEQDPDKKAEKLKGIPDATKIFYSFIEDSIKKGGGKYFVGNKISVADLAVFCHLDQMLTSRFAIPGILDPYPGLVAYHKAIAEEPKLKSYLGSRPPSEF